MRYPLFGICILISAMPAQALAADAVVTQRWWEALVQFGLQIILAVVAVVLPVLVGALLRRYNIQVQAQQYEAAVSTAVSAVEQLANAKLHAGQPPDAGAEKMKKAIEIANSLIQEFKLKELATDKLTHLIEAKLGAAPKTAPVLKTPAWAEDGPTPDSGKAPAPTPAPTPDKA